MTFASIVVPAFNVESTLARTLTSLCAQTYPHFEIIVVDDGSYDGTNGLAHSFADDPRVQVVRQINRGLAGARNTGIVAARGDVIGFCDADDLWAPTKLARHIAHLEVASHVGISFSGSELIDEADQPTGLVQRPRLRNVSTSHIFKRNPIGNGSAPVVRRAVFDAIAYRPAHEQVRDWYFDETFRQSEDIECWLRIALSTDWVFEGIEGLLTQYRVASGGLSANTLRQNAAWERMVSKLTTLNPAFFARHAPAARAYQLRYLCRRAISACDADEARALAVRSFASSWRPLLEEPAKTVSTTLAAAVLCLAGPALIRHAMLVKSRFA